MVSPKVVGTAGELSANGEPCSKTKCFREIARHGNVNFAEAMRFRATVARLLSGHSLSLHLPLMRQAASLCLPDSMAFRARTHTARSRILVSWRVCVWGVFRRWNDFRRKVAAVWFQQQALIGACDAPGVAPDLSNWPQETTRVRPG